MIVEEWRLRTTCQQCGFPVAEWITAPRPEPDSDGVDETATFEIACDNCGEITVVEVSAKDGIWSAHVQLTGEAASVEHFDYRDDQWYEQLVPEPHPFDNYIASFSDWKTLLSRFGDAQSGHADINRMLLVQLFSIFEAYISDAITGYIYGNPSAALAVIKWHPELKHETVLLGAVAENPNLPRDTVISKLRRTQFHRFEHINSLLRATMNHQLLPANKEDRGKILRAGMTRHDCVHRNGRDHEGNLVDWISTTYLHEIAGLFESMIKRLASRLDEMDLREEKSRHLAEVSARLNGTNDDIPF